MSTFLNAGINVESIIIIAVDWTGDGQVNKYADKDLLDANGDVIIPGCILQVGEIESLLSFKTGDNISIQFTLDDTGSLIKAFLDKHDPYGKPCWVYQYFDDSTLDPLVDPLLLFKGKINYDVAWAEGTRTVSFTVLSEVEEREVGFSPEEGQFEFVNPDLIGKPWPLCFGSPIHVPATLVSTAKSSTLNDRICFVEPSLIYKRKLIYQAILANYSIYIYHAGLALSVLQTAGISAQGMLASILDNIHEQGTVVTDYVAVLKDIADTKYDISQAQRGRINANIKQLRKDLAGFQAEKRRAEDGPLGILQGNFELLVDKIPFLEASIQQRKAAQDAQIGAIQAMSQLYQEYLQLDIEICRQARCITDTVRVKDGDNFPQNVSVDVFINNLRFRGVFNNDTFTIIDKLPKYQNVTLAAREELDEPCSPDEHYSVFWVPDESIQLAGLFILVYSNRDNQYHVIKVIEQEGRLCRFELTNHPYKTQSDEINERVQSPAPFVAVSNREQKIELFEKNLFPLGNFATGIMDQFIVEQTRPEYITSLGQLPFDVQSWLSGNNPSRTNLWTRVNDNLYDLLLKLSKLREKDNLLYFIQLNDLTPVKAFTITAYNFDIILEASPIILERWFDNVILVDELSDTGAWSADQGAVIVDAVQTCEIYVANLIPGTVKSVNAYRTVDGHRALVTVPTRYYTWQTEELPNAEDRENDQDYLDLTTIRVKVPLQSLNEGWERGIYISLISSVGPNVVDVIQYLIETYTDKQVDITSFDLARNQMMNYPVNFALFDQKNVFSLINEIAQLARAVVYIRNDVYYILYLGLKPTPVVTIDESDVIQGSLVISYSDLTNVVTRLTATWRKDYAPDTEPNKVVLRHNIQKYGLHEAETNYFIYNIEELVVKSATFWLIRNAFSWKRIQFKTFLHNLSLESFDAVTFVLPFIADTTVVGIIEEVSYNSNDNDVTIVAWLPVLSGDMVENIFAWPGSAPVDAEFALDVDVTGSGNFTITGELESC